VVIVIDRASIKAALHIVVCCTTHAPEWVPTYEEIGVRKTAELRCTIVIRLGVNESPVRHLEVALRPSPIPRRAVVVRNRIGHDPILPRRHFNASTIVIVDSDPLALEAVALCTEAIGDQ